MKPRRSKAEKSVKAWGGFVDDKLDMLAWPTSESFTPVEWYAAVFKFPTQAKRRYSDVREIEIRVIPKKPRRR